MLHGGNPDNVHRPISKDEEKGLDETELGVADAYDPGI